MPFRSFEILIERDSRKSNFQPCLRVAELSKRHYRLKLSPRKPPIADKEALDFAAMSESVRV